MLMLPAKDTALMELWSHTTANFLTAAADDVLSLCEEHGIG